MHLQSDILDWCSPDTPGMLNIAGSPAALPPVVVEDAVAELVAGVVASIYQVRSSIYIFTCRSMLQPALDEGGDKCSAQSLSND